MGHICHCFMRYHVRVTRSASKPGQIPNTLRPHPQPVGHSPQVAVEVRGAYLVEVASIQGNRGERAGPTQLYTATRRCQTPIVAKPSHLPVLDGASTCSCVHLSI